MQQTMARVENSMMAKPVSPMLLPWSRVVVKEITVRLKEYQTKATITATTNNGLTASIDVLVLAKPVPTSDVKYRLFASYNFFDSSVAGYLPFPRNNAQSVVKVFGGSKINGQKYSTKVVGNGSKTAILSGISGFFADADDNDVSVVYLCSHGVMTGNYKGYRMTLPGYVNANSSPNYYMSSSEIFNAVKRIKGRVILIVDSCYSGTFLEDQTANLNAQGGRISVLTAASNTSATYYKIKDTNRAVDFFTFFLLQGLGYNEKDGWYNADAAGNKVYFNSALNNKLTWETSEQIDLGVDLNMFRDRLSMSFDVYDKRTYNLIQGQTMNWTSSIGLSAMLVNQGEVRNRGFEATVGWNDEKGDWTYFVNANYSYNKNWVSDIGVMDANGNKGLWIDGTSYFRAIADFYRTQEGMPIRSYYLTECLGIFQNWDEIYSYTKDGELIQPDAQPGDLKFKDFNDDGKITLDAREYWGNAMPNSTFALTVGGSWRNLSASVMLQGVLGAQALYAGKYEIYNEGSTLTNKEKRILTDSWAEGKTNATIPMYKRADANGNYSTPSTWYLEDTSYLRVKNVTLGYDFTSLLRKSDHFKSKNASMSVYLSGENLFTFTKYTGMDPEVDGYDAIKYPISRIVSLGVKLNY